jgi:hypothetical protein
LRLINVKFYQNMKKIKLNGKLNLNKETVSKLNDEQMRQVNGGFTSFVCSLAFCGGGGSKNCPTRNNCPPLSAVCDPSASCACTEDCGSAYQSACGQHQCF